jgi:solute carrier family 25 (mitochondrial carnitine/acylcarnitine transporter), member 20/29
MSHVFLSGILTGMVSSVVLSPADHIRILLQKQIRAQRYKGSLDAGRDIYRRHNIKGLYLGFTPTFLREVLSNAVYFYSYEYIMRLFAGGKSSSEAPIMGAFLAGGLAGSNSWLLTYPVDYLKTVIQSQDLKHLRYRGVLHCAREQYRK